MNALSADPVLRKHPDNEELHNRNQSTQLTDETMTPDSSDDSEAANESALSCSTVIVQLQIRCRGTAVVLELKLRRLSRQFCRVASY
jgi:hypothetical protein